jgi:hypothetical protein
MKNLGINSGKYVSIIFLIAVLLISLLLSGYTYLVSTYDSTLPIIYEGIENQTPTSNTADEMAPVKEALSENNRNKR